MEIKLENNNYEPPVHGLRLLQVCIVLFFIIFCARFWYLQVHKGEEFAKLALENRMRTARTFAARGEIYDIKGNVLAENHIAFALALVRENAYDTTASLAQVSEWTGVPFEKIQERYVSGRRLTKAFEPIFLVQDLPFEQIAPIQAELYKWPGIEVVPRPIRNYPQKNNLAHIMGYVAEVKKEELENNEDYSLGDIVGRQGIEYVLEDRLRGVKAYKSMEVDVRGRVLNSKILEEAQSGNNVILNLDADLQKQIADIMGEYSGSVIVMEPDTGAVRAFVTKPSYDNNLFVTGFSRAEWDAVRNHPRFPLQNRTIQSVYPPGSVWKLMMVGMLLDNGIDPEEEVFCGGRYTLGNRTFRCWKDVGHGKMNMQDAVSSSCDVYFFDMAERFGIDLIERYAKASGFGRKTGIDLPHENSGLVPSREWKERRFSERWQTGDTINVSIGQGFTLVTPVQLAVFVGAVVNGGHLLKPQLLASEPTEIKGEFPFTLAHQQLIKDYMIKTVSGGFGATAKVLARDDVIIGAKTGTAQVVKLKMVGTRRQKNAEADFYERDHAWIGSFAEQGDKKYVVITMLEHGGGGSSAAGPVTKAVYELLFPKEIPEETSVGADGTSNPVFVDNSQRGEG